MGDVREPASGVVYDAADVALVARVAAAREAFDAADAERVAATVAAVRSGALSQVAAARVAGVDRHTLRGWLGLPRRRPGRPAAGG